MAKYEIMLIVRGDLEESAASKIANELKNSLKEKNIKEINYGLKDMAYEIKKIKKGYYFQYNFEAEESAGINEFRRLCGINKNVLRHLIINIEKDYGYRATINPKKVSKSEFKKVQYVKFQEEAKKRAEERQAAYEARKAEMRANSGRKYDTNNKYDAGNK